MKSPHPATCSMTLVDDGCHVGMACVCRNRPD